MSLYGGGKWQGPWSDPIHNPHTHTYTHRSISTHRTDRPTHGTHAGTQARTLKNLEVRRGAQLPPHCLPVQVPVRLRPRAPDGRALPAVEDLEVDA